MTMELSWWLIQIAVFAASLLQAATGIGFGVIAGPILLLLLNSSSAIQVSIALSLAIAVVLAPSIYRKFDRSTFKLLLYGTCAGIPLGIVLFLNVNLVALKLLAGLVVTFMALSTAGIFKPSRDAMGNQKTVVGIGLVSGVMSSSLGMPGPVPATWMITKKFRKEVIRATILFLFIPSYLAALGIQAIAPGLSQSAMWWSLTLLPSTLAGVFIGKLLESRISELLFRKIITMLLALTALSLFVDIAYRYQG